MPLQLGQDVWAIRGRARDSTRHTLTTGLTTVPAVGFTSSGASLSGARIGGMMNLTDAKLTYGSGGTPALYAHRIIVNDDVPAWRLTATGLVILTGARIGGELILSSARLDTQGADTLDADKITIDGDLDGRGLTVTGGVSLAGARIGGTLTLDSATITGHHRFFLSHKASAGLHQPSCPALTAYGLTVGQDMYCSGKFTATGRSTLRGPALKGDSAWTAPGSPTRAIPHPGSGEVQPCRPEGSPSAVTFPVLQNSPLTRKST